MRTTEVNDILSVRKLIRSPDKKLICFALLGITILIALLFVIKRISHHTHTAEIHPYHTDSASAMGANSKSTLAAQYTYFPGQRGRFIALEDCSERSEPSCANHQSYEFLVPESTVVFWAVGTGKDDQHFAFPVFVASPSQRQGCLLINTLTIQAYNKFGGKNFYQTPYDTPVSVSFARPVRAQKNAHAYSFPIIDFLDEHGLDLNVFDEVFLHTYDDYLDQNCEYLVLSGHHEYWSTQITSQVKRFIKAGRNVLNASGNIAYWKVAVDTDQQSIQVDKRSSEIAHNRFAKFDQEVTDIFGGYYLGYPISRKIKQSDIYLEKFPELSRRVGFKKLKSVTITDPNSPLFNCFESGTTTVSSDALRKEVDGVLLSLHYSKQSGKKSSEVNSLAQVPGHALKAWAVYGKSIREIVVGRAYENEYGGRQVILGSIGWTHAAKKYQDISLITSNAIAYITGKPSLCNK